MSGPSGGAAAARRPPPRAGGPFGGPSLPAEKPRNLKASFRRLLGTLTPEAPRIGLVIALAILSVTCAVVGPKILGNATDILFDGVVGQQIPPGADPAAGGRRPERRGSDAAGRPAGQPRCHAGRRRRLHRASQHASVRRRDLRAELALRVGAGLHHGGRVATDGVSDASGCRSEARSTAVALFDSHPRGDMLSRVTDDIDNIANSLSRR